MNQPHVLSRDIPLIPGSSALLVVDMQNFCCRNDHEHQSEYYRSTLLSVENKLCAMQRVCRENNIEVMFTVIENMTKDGRDRGLDYKISGFNVPKGSFEAEVISTLSPIGDEMVFSKTSSSCFISTNIDYVLRSMGIKQLIVCGGLTDQCISSTVRDACDLGYLVTVPTDCCISKSPDLHTSSLTAISGYCRLVTSDILASELAKVSTGMCPTEKPPSSANPAPPTHEMDQGPIIRTHRIAWVDSAGIIRCRGVTAEAFTAVRVQGLGLTMASMAMLGHVDAVANGTGLGVVGEVRLVPDECTYRLPWMPSHSLSFGSLYFPLRVPWCHCPRAILRKALQRARIECDELEIYIGFEIEVLLLRKGTLDPIDSSNYCSARCFDANASLVDDMVAALQALGIVIEQFHCESANGQYELVLQYRQAEVMVDQLYLARMAITAIADRHGVDASFLPKSRSSQAGNGQHMHMSMWRKGQNIFTVNGAHDPVKEGIADEYSPPTEAAAFIAGVLHHLPALMAVTMPSPNSFRRVQPSCWSGAFQCWGVDNREAPLRVCSAPQGPPNNFEVKCFDATANAYIGVAAVIIAGVDGMKRKLKLPKPVQVDPALLDVSVRPPPLPTHTSIAIASLRANEVLLQGLGREVLTCLAAVREGEERALGGMSLEDEVEMMMLKY